MHEVIKKYEAAVKEAFGADLCNWSCLMNVAFRDLDPQPQVHWHVRPRYSKSVIVQGKEYYDPNFGMHYDISLDAKETPDFPENEQEAIANCIRAKLG